MDQHDLDCACREYRDLSRRHFIQGTAGAALLAAFRPDWLPRVVVADSANSTRDVIVNIFMRGGADSLSLVAPFADTNYYAGRPTLAIPRPDATVAGKGTALDNTFMFSPGMLGLYPAYQAAQLAVVHGAGLTYNSRSHFDAQRYIERGKAADTSVTTGWIGRHLAASTPARAGAVLRALAISSGLPNSFDGAPNALPISDPTNFQISGSAATGAAREAFLTADFFLDLEPARSSALGVTATLNLLRSLNLASYKPSNGAVYPASSFGRAMRSAAAMIKSDVGVEAIEVDIGGWDTHVAEDPKAGSLFKTMSDFSGSIGAFWADVMQGNGSFSVTLVAMSEFGRNVRENGNAGTDHGRGGAMFVMGRSVNGGKVYTNSWKPLARENLADGQDVPVTIDHRDILAEIVQKRLSNPNIGAIFPGYTPTNYNIAT
ncbi:MAG: DUF1501 domain-containing protein [Gemmatimonadetes bacterium]|nr:DUF1501 domain-containing protein [Gemmatimonadota bacterium]MBI3569126.1 DUF1501 domain-containing protein [Gemmatimonadota bacterium]